MTDRDALLAAALGKPADDTARLVLDDSLEEHAEPELGRFLRAGVTAAETKGRVAGLRATANERPPPESGVRSWGAHSFRPLAYSLSRTASPSPPITTAANMPMVPYP